MKQVPIKKINNPGYPTLDQVGRFSKVSSVTKVAAVTALAATMSLATACGDNVSGVKSGSGSFKGMANGWKSVNPFQTEETWQIDGEIETQTEPPETTEEIWMGEETVETDPTEEIWMGEETVETTDESYVLDGDVICTTDSTTDGTTEDTTEETWPER